ncbi:MAG: N-acetylneuraminate synthase family protein [Sedimentisphaerales bacterium]|nr:N-acetylneuraminate synthase family protein [Sedimentisphaerales bacterium]
MKKINGTKCPYIIAEAGVNHNGQLATALELVKAAHGAGADCIKFQAFTAEELVVKNAEKAQYQKRSGPKGESQYDMLQRLELKESEFAAIKKYCDELEIDFLVTSFSPRWVRAFYEMGVTAFKIGSGNLDDIDLLKAIGQTHLPVIISTGMSELNEVDRALTILRKYGSEQIAVLHCVSLYPTQLEQANLSAVKTIAEHTHLPTGFSDHTEELITGALAVAAGAVILEKHFTLDKKMEGPDHRMSLEPEELTEYIRLARQAGKACGDGQKKPLTAEEKMKETVRMSVVAATFIKAGTKITPEMITIKRPGTGIPAEQMDVVINTTASRDIEPGHIINRNDLITL